VASVCGTGLITDKNLEGRVAVGPLPPLLQCHWLYCGQYTNEILLAMIQ